jgi:2-hydroxychromene-2-carboxylate isomerase
MGAQPTVHWFHGVADPYSHLGVQLLAPLMDRYAIRLVPHLVPAPAAAAAPEPARLAGWALRDSAQLAAAHELSFPDSAALPAPASVSAVEAALAGLDDPRAFAARAAELGAHLWRGAAVEATPTGDAAAALAAGQAALTAAGHYLPGVFAFEGETYWGVDRLPHLEARLLPFRREGGPLVRQLEASDAAGDAQGAELHFFLSFRSPYTHIAAARVRRLAARWNARLVLRPVLPMVMRGLPVPLEKRMYILRDTKREAERLGIAFGRVCDPVGAGVERGLAVLHRAIALGRGPAFAESFLAGAFAEAVDASTDAGLGLLAARAGLTDADVAAALADEGWRAVAEANRAELFAAGLWGVPSFRVGTLPPHWGQDRLWAVEADLAEGRR